MIDSILMSCLRGAESKFRLGMEYLEEQDKEKFNIKDSDSQLEVLAKLDPVYKCATNVLVTKQRRKNGDVEWKI